MLWYDGQEQNNQFRNGNARKIIQMRSRQMNFLPRKGIAVEKRHWNKNCIGETVLE